MKHFILLGWLLVLLALHTQAQSRFSIAPSYGYTFGHEAFTLQTAHAEVLRVSGTSCGFTLGLTAHYAISPRWDLSVGLLYAGFVSKVQSYNPQSYWTFGQKQPNDYTQLPVLINYRVSDKRLAPYLSAGALLSNQSIIANQIGIKTSALVGIGIDYRLSPKLTLLVQPTGSYLLTRPREDAFNQFRPFSSYLIGLQTQLRWRF